MILLVWFWWGFFGLESLSLLIFKVRCIFSVFQFLLHLAYQAIIFEELFDVGGVLYIFYKPR